MFKFPRESSEFLLFTSWKASNNQMDNYLQNHGTTTLDWKSVLVLSVTLTCSSQKVSEKVLTLH